MPGYPSSAAARILELSVEEVRRFARAGFVSARRGPRNTLRLSFQDLVLLRAAAGLVRARVPAARVRRALRTLAARLPAGRSLASIAVGAEGGAVVVRDGGARWHPETGQVLLELEVRESARRVAPLRRAGVRRGAPLDAEAWHRSGRGLADGAPSEARAAFRQALALEPHHAGAHLGLGRLLRQAGDPRAAEYHLRLASQAPEHRAHACVELGAALEEQGLPDEALLAYARALAARPGLAAAHEGAARLLERLGRKADALRHAEAAGRIDRG